jgi:hypothetical protein
VGVAIYRKVNGLSSEDAAYLAGLIDGEGTIALSHRHRGEERQLVVSISNTERELLDYVLETVGAGRITAKRTYDTNHSPSFTYSIDNRQALELLQQIAPFLRGYKRQRAALVLEDYVRLTPRNGRYTSEMKTQREAFIVRFLAMKAQFTR